MVQDKVFFDRIKSEIFDGNVRCIIDIQCEMGDDRKTYKKAVKITYSPKEGNLPRGLKIISVLLLLFWR